MSTRKERILRKLNPTLLKITPKLSGDAGSFIDLDSEDSLEDGAKKLMMRFLRNQDIHGKNKRSSGHEAEVTISSAKYNENEEICELITERLSLPLVKKEENDTSERPGKRLQTLKMELQEKISAKWEEEYKKRVSENKSIENHKQRKKKSQKSSGSESESDDEDMDEKWDEMENYSEKDEEADDESDDKEENESAAIILQEDKQIDKSNNCESEETGFGRENEYDENDACSLMPAYQPGGGLLYGGSELTQAEEGLPQNLLSPSLRLSMNESPRSKLSESYGERTPNKKEYVSNEDEDSLFIGKKKLFSQNTSNSFDLNDAFEFCSGKFPVHIDPTSNQNGKQQPSKIKTNITKKNRKENTLNFNADNAGSQNTAESEADADADGDAEASDYEDVEEGDKFEGEDNDDDGDDDNDEGCNSSEEIANEEELPKDGQKTRKNIIAFEDSDEEEEEGEKMAEEQQVEEVEEPHPRPLELLSEDEDEATSGNNDSKVNKRKKKSLHFSDEEDEGSDREGEDEAGDCEGDGVTNDRADSDSEKADDEEEDVRSVQYDSEENEIINPKEFFEKEAELSGSEWSGDEDERGLDEFDAEEGDADNLDNNEVRSQLEKIHIRRVLDDDAKEVRLIQEILFEDGDLHSDGKRRDRKFKWKNLGTFEEQENNGGAADEGEISSDDCAEEEKQRKMRYEKELFLMTKNNGDMSSDEEITADFQMVKLTRVKAINGSSTDTDKSKAMMSYTEIEKNTVISKTRGSFLARNDEFLSRLAKATASVTNSLSGPKNSRNFVFATKSPDKNAEKNSTCKRQVEDPGNCGRLEKRIKVLPPEVDTGPSILDLLV